MTTFADRDGVERLIGTITELAVLGPDLEVTIGNSTAGFTVTRAGLRMFAADFPGVPSVGVGLDFPALDAFMYVSAGLLQWVAASNTLMLTSTGGPSDTVVLAGPNTDPVVAVQNDALGFFGGAPAAQPTGVPVTAAGIHAALVALNLITA